MYNPTWLQCATGPMFEEAKKLFPADLLETKRLETDVIPQPTPEIMAWVLTVDPAMLPWLDYISYGEFIDSLKPFMDKEHWDKVESVANRIATQKLHDIESKVPEFPIENVGTVVVTRIDANRPYLGARITLVRKESEAGAAEYFKEKNGSTKSSDLKDIELVTMNYMPIEATIEHSEVYYDSKFQGSIFNCAVQKAKAAAAAAEPKRVLVHVTFEWVKNVVAALNVSAAKLTDAWSGKDANKNKVGTMDLKDTEANAARLTRFGGKTSDKGVIAAANDMTKYGFYGAFGYKDDKNVGRESAWGHNVVWLKSTQPIRVFQAAFTDLAQGAHSTAA